MTPSRHASLSITIFLSLLRLMSIKLVMPSNHLILCRPLLLLPSIFPSIRVFSNEFLHTRWAEYWSFSFSISPSNKYSGQISYRTDCFNLLAVQGISRVFSNTQFKSINFLALSFVYGPTQTSVHDYWKNHSFEYTDFVTKLMFLLFNMLSGFVRAFLPRSKGLLISWLQLLSTVRGYFPNLPTRWERR